MLATSFTSADINEIRQALTLRGIPFRDLDRRAFGGTDGKTLAWLGAAV